MQVVKLTTNIVCTPAPHIGGMYWIFLGLETKCGIQGVGEVYAARSEERRVGKECRSRWSPYH